MLVILTSNMMEFPNWLDYLTGELWTIRHNLISKASLLSGLLTTNLINIPFFP